MKDKHGPNIFVDNYFECGYKIAALPPFETGEAQILVQSERKGEEKEDFNRCGF